MDEQKIKLETRLYIIELFIANQLAITALHADCPADQLLGGIRQQMLEGARNMTFPSYHPAMSDMIAGELETACEKILDMASDQISQAQQRRQS